jgi:ankyrin repeat protein
MNNLSSYIFESEIKSALKLLNNGTDINAEYGSRPISAAINSDNPETLKFVIEHGADVNIDNGAPLHELIDYCIDGMIQNNKTKPYPEAMEMLSILLNNGANLELVNENGERPIDVISVYADGDKKTLFRLKSFFKSLIPHIDELI